MDEKSSQDDLFEIKIDETGKAYIRRLVKIAIACFIFSMIWGSIVIMWSIRDAYLYRDYEVSGKNTFFLYRMQPYIVIVLNILMVLGNYFYVKFFRRLKSGIDTNDSALFNKAFTHLITNAFLFIVSALGFIALQIWAASLLFL